MYPDPLESPGTETAQEKSLTSPLIRLWERGLAQYISVYLHVESVYYTA